MAHRPLDHADPSCTRAIGRGSSTLSCKHGAFYDPKIDFGVTDAIGRSGMRNHPLDYQPAALRPEYIGAYTRSTPVSFTRHPRQLRRFIAMLISLCWGIPLAAAPRCRFGLPIADRHVVTRRPPSSGWYAGLRAGSRAQRNRI